jgi:multicomponent Na+:H+ antiporter subunit B
MNSLILKHAALVLKPLFLVFSVFVLLRGHNEPGGGFVGGLVASAAFVLHGIAHDVASARRHLFVEPHFLMGCGLLLAAGSGIVPLFFNRPFLTGIWTEIHLSRFSIALGTPLLFDIGVYLVVLGASLTIFFNIQE